jgi:hypothetical protein
VAVALNAERGPRGARFDRQGITTALLSIMGLARFVPQRQNPSDPFVEQAFRTTPTIFAGPICGGGMDNAAEAVEGPPRTKFALATSSRQLEVVQVLPAMQSGNGTFGDRSKQWKVKLIDVEV